MGDHGGWAQPNGLLPNKVDSVTRVLDSERLLKAEEKIGELIALIQPNKPSEERRIAVANYVQRLIRKCFSCEVFTYGSVPLKTYLPDGDIDLTAFSKDDSLKDTWANDVREALENEEKNENAEFHVKEVQYIQAEVKIIKCLVEDIVVDISFNQLGGLCTLCFLEEIDSLINQDHLFKRSIILIKAWCYYESRILGAHHGLISTYALETLVLYIFHVFNNSFSGPLEVLYRFLKFFSKFDWDNFCVSLWGPVPISSLPDMTSEPPRKDSGDLLLSKLFLENRSEVYAVLPVGQDYQSQPFISKHFNVIDPLRLNNNLGRSVSKGNFFRIRSAFAFGAERLASMLECPKEDLIAGVSQFFMNTWERYGSGHRPDAPSPNLHSLRPVNTIPVQELNDSRSTSSVKKNKEDVGSPASHQYQADGNPPLYENSSQTHRSINQPSHNIHKISNPSSISRIQSQKNYGSQINPNASDHTGRNGGASEVFQTDKSQKNLRLNNPVNSQGGQSRLQFARAHSSPELTNTSAEVSFRGSLQTSNNQTATRLDHGNRKKKLGSDTSGGQQTSSVDDPSSSRIGSSQQILDSSDSRSASNSYHDDGGFTTNGEELASVAETLNMQQEMHQEELETVNMMASSGVHNFGEQVQMPIHLASSHLSFPLPPSFVTPMGYSQRNMAGIVPTSINLIEPPWASSMQFPQGLVSSPSSPYFSTASLGSNFEDTVGLNNKSCGAAEVNLEESDHGYWDELEAGSNLELEPDNGDFQVLCSDDKQQSASVGFNLISTSQLSSTVPFVPVHQKIPRENKGSLSEGYIGASQHQGSWGNDDRNGTMRYIPVSQASSSEIKPISGSLTDGYSKTSKSLRDRRGRKAASSAVLTSFYGKSSSKYQPESSSDNSSVLADDEASSQARSHQLPRYDPTRVNGSDPVIPVAPMLVTGPRQRMMDNSGVVPFAFYPTGPPIPFLAIPVYNILSEAGNSAGSMSQHKKDEGLDHDRIDSSYQNFDSAESLNQSESHMYSNAFRSAEPEPYEQRKSDILNGDFLSHWQNLQYGRSCQNTRQHAQFMYPSPVMIPPIYLQGHYPWDGAGGPCSANTNVFAQIMNHIPRLVPLSPLQPGPHKTTGAFQRFGDEVPRYRGGTGTYLPNPQKVSYRDRQTSNTRNHRGSYNYDRNNHADRESSWINAKSRTAGHSHVRVQAEKLASRTDRFATITTDNRVDRQWESYIHEPISHYQAENSSVRPSNSSHNSGNMGYSMYSVPAVNSNGVSAAGSSVPSVVMLYSYDQGVAYGPPPQPLEFGSLGPVHLSGMDEAAQPSDENAMLGAYDRRHGTYRADSMHSSPDQPSSPHLQRSTVQRNYQLKDEDFPPLSFSNGVSGEGSNDNCKPAP